MAYAKDFLHYDPECWSIHRNVEFSLLPTGKLVSATVPYFRPCFPVYGIGVCVCVCVCVCTDIALIEQFHVA